MDPSAPDDPAPAARPRRRYLRWLRLAVSLLIFGLVIGLLVIPQISGTRDALDTLGDVDTPWLVLGVGLELCALLSYSMLSRSVLPGDRPSFWWIFRCDITGNGVSHVVPGGAATASALRYRLIRDGGVPPEDALVGAAVQAIGSALVLNVLLWSALMVSIPLEGWHPLYMTAAVVCAVVIGVSVVLYLGFARDSERSLRLIGRATRLLPDRIRGSVDAGLHRTSARVGRVLGHTPTLRRAALWATLYWSLDAGALWVFLSAYNWHAGPLDLAVSFGLAQVVALVPITPGGIGIIEGVLIPSFVGFGGPHAEVVLGVVSWRIVQFWATIPAALLCYLSLQASARTGGVRETIVTLFARRRTESGNTIPIKPVGPPESKSDSDRSR